jgi:serine/threonine-protein kinase
MSSTWTIAAMSKSQDRPAAAPPWLVEKIIDEQRRRWGQGERILVETYLQQQPILGSDHGVILDLIYNEVVLREKTGERPQQEEYAQRFPHLSAELALQFEVDRGLDWQAVTAASLEGGERPEALTRSASKAAPAREPSGGTPFPALSGYTISGVLGRGATGVVYKARQLSLDRGVAIKVVVAPLQRVGLSSRIRENSDVHSTEFSRIRQQVQGIRETCAVSQLRAEAAKLARLHHTNICPIYEIGADAGRIFIAQERVESNLAKRRADGPVSPREAARWLETLARTIHDIHAQGIVHGNLTPSNILLSYSGTLKITDIGLTRFFSGCHPPKADTPFQQHQFRPLPDGGREHAVAESWHQLGLEQAKGDPDAIGRASDVQRLGAILYALLVGRPPFIELTATQMSAGRQEWPPHVDPTPPSRLRPDVPRDLETICLCCLQSEPPTRYATALELAADLTAYLASKPIRARRVGFVKRILRSVRSWSLLTGKWSPAGTGRLAQAALQQRLRAERVELALDLTCRLVRITSRAELLGILAEATAWLTDAELVTIFLVNKERGDLWAHVSRGAGVEELRLPLGAGIAGIVATTGEPINLSDAKGDARFDPETDRYMGVKTRTLLALPLMDAERGVVGIVQAINKRGGAFTAADVEALAPLLAPAAVAIERATKE